MLFPITSGGVIIEQGLTGATGLPYVRQLLSLFRDFSLYTPGKSKYPYHSTSYKPLLSLSIDDSDLSCPTCPSNNVCHQLSSLSYFKAGIPPCSPSPMHSTSHLQAKYTRIEIFRPGEKVFQSPIIREYCAKISAGARRATSFG